jgi:hypothetical protein
LPGLSIICIRVHCHSRQVNLIITQPVIYQEIDDLGESALSVSRSQVTFMRKKKFVWIWIPNRFLKGKYAPLGLTFSFRYRQNSPRWKQIIEPAPAQFTHHLELFALSEIDNEVRDWLREAWEAAG